MSKKRRPTSKKQRARDRRAAAKHNVPVEKWRATKRPGRG